MNHLHSYDKLFEAKQVGTLYHYTPIMLLQKILRDNFLKEDRHGKCVSLTRNSNFHQTPGYGISTQCRFILNGDKLSQRYKIYPFAQEATPDQPSTWKGHPENQGVGYNEFEERVDGTIKNLKNYLMGVQVNEILFLRPTVQATLAEIKEEFGIVVGEFHTPVSDQYY